MENPVLNNDGNTDTQSIVVHPTDINPKRFTSKRFGHPHCLRASISPNTIVCMVEPEEDSIWILSQVQKSHKKEWQSPEDGYGLSINPSELIEKEGCSSLIELLQQYNNEDIPIRELRNGSDKIRAFKFQK